MQIYEAVGRGERATEPKSLERTNIGAFHFLFSVERKDSRSGES